MTPVFALAAFALVLNAGARLLPLERVPAPAAIAIWLCVLSMGALGTIAMVATTIAYLPTTTIYSLIAGFCLHATLPIAPPHFDISGHTALHLAVTVPLTGLLLSMLWLVFRLARGWWVIRGQLRRSVLVDQRWTLIEDENIVIGVPLLGRRRIIVSDAALRLMDPPELEAGIQHEAGHIRRGHRWIILIGRSLAALSFAIPGTRRAETNLFHALERDADEYAIRQTGDPLSLASAICKAALGPGPARGIGLASGRVGLRLDHLEGRLKMAGSFTRRSIHLITITILASTLFFAVSTATWTAGARGVDHVWSLSSTDC